jgi:uncharacterized membrane protein YccC
VQPDLETIVSADEEGRRRVAKQRERLAARIQEARDAAEQGRVAHIAAVRAEYDETIRKLQEASRLRLDERRRRHEDELRRWRERSESALESAAERYLAILFPEAAPK